MPDAAPPVPEPSAPPSAARQRILLTAHDLFYRDGIRATGVDRVIAESGVTKVTFYRHFPSKNDLILAFLAHRHTRWMAWFDEALTRHGNTIAALAPTLAEWASDPGYRGCAFINSVGEMGQTLPEVVTMSRQHKRDMVARIATLLPPGPTQADDAEALGLALDGAILRAQFDQAPTAAVSTLRHTVARVSAACQAEAGGGTPWSPGAGRTTTCKRVPDSPSADAAAAVSS